MAVHKAHTPRMEPPKSEPQVVLQAEPFSQERVLIESAPESRLWIAAHTRERLELSQGGPGWA